MAEYRLSKNVMALNSGQSFLSNSFESVCCLVVARDLRERGQNMRVVGVGGGE
jgi:hypothetical protein